MGELFVKGDGDEFVIEKDNEDKDGKAEDERGNDIAVRREEDVAENEAFEVNGLSRRVVEEDQACSHAEGPDRTDDGVLAFAEAVKETKREILSFLIEISKVDKKAKQES